MASTPQSRVVSLGSTKTAAPDSKTTLTPLFVGLNLPTSNGVSDMSVVEAAVVKGYDMITSRITSRAYRKRIQSLFQELERFKPSSLFAADGGEGSSPSPQASPDLDGESITSSATPEVPVPGLEDVVLHPGPHVSNSIALASPWVELDSKNPRVANISFQVLEHELVYASFCGLPYVIIPGPKRRTNIVQYSQAVNSLLQRAPFLHLMIHLPFAEEGSSTDPLSIWDVWQTIRHLCGYSPNLSIALQVPRHAPAPVVTTRWFAEPVSALVLSPSVFVPNAKGFPVLPKNLQSILWQFFKKTSMVILEDPASVEFNGGDDGMLLYIRHLHSSAPEATVEEQFAAGYMDYLQSPLQPLVDNLESSTYEVFERDPVKYNQYEKALYRALMDRPNKHVRVGVVGAGRGPLVDRAISAARAAARAVTVYALEKNSSAIVYLKKRQAEEWGADMVKIVNADMRSWDPPEVLDIVVSELLGSFADNELSPECLDGAQRLLDPAGGIMIPQSYSAYVTPIMSSKLYTAASNIGTTGNDGAVGMGMSPAANAALSATRPGANSGNSSAFHTPYVVMLQQVDFVSDSTKLVWRFKHPISQVLPKNQHNTRTFKESFRIPKKCIVHGLAGYFESVLYKDVSLSTLPETKGTKSKDMVSWFPMWFPLSQPVYLSDESEMDVSMWRLTDGKKVWYEWAVESYALASLADNGSKSSIDSHRTVKRIRTGVSELHNSGGRHYAMIL